MLEIRSKVEVPLKSNQPSRFYRPGAVEIARHRCTRPVSPYPRACGIALWLRQQIGFPCVYVYGEGNVFMND